MPTDKTKWDLDTQSTTPNKMKEYYLAFDDKYTEYLKRYYAKENIFELDKMNNGSSDEPAFW